MGRISAVFTTDREEAGGACFGGGTHESLGLTAAPGRTGTVAMTVIYQGLGTKEEKWA
jgi:hypothetical protein